MSIEIFRFRIIMLFRSHCYRHLHIGHTDRVSYNLCDHVDRGDMIDSRSKTLLNLTLSGIVDY